METNCALRFGSGLVGSMIRRDRINGSVQKPLHESGSIGGASQWRIYSSLRAQVSNFVCSKGQMMRRRFGGYIQTLGLGIANQSHSLASADMLHMQTTSRRVANSLDRVADSINFGIGRAAIGRMHEDWQVGHTSPPQTELKSLRRDNGLAVIGQRNDACLLERERIG